MVLQRLHGVVQIIWRVGELPRSASSHFIAVQLIQIFSAHGSIQPATGHGGTRGPRGPKNTL